MNNHDGVLKKPFLAEHWHKGFVAGAAIWLPAFLPVYSMLAESLNNRTQIAVGVASAISILLFFAVITHHEGFSLDPENKSYRLYTWILGLQFGKWQPLPVITHLSIRPYQKGHYMPVATTPADPVDLGWIATERSWQVLLSVKNSPIGIVAAYATHLEAKRISFALSQLLHVENVEHSTESFQG